MTRDRSSFAADPAAPVFSTARVTIAADADAVWDVLADVSGWPQWNPAVKSARIPGGIDEGTPFEWKAGPGTIRSVFRVVERPRLLGWTGRTLGIPARHVYRLEPDGTRTTVVTEESWDGLLAHLFKKTLRKTLDAAIREGLDALKAEAETRATARG